MLRKCRFVLALLACWTGSAFAQYSQADVEAGYTLYNANCITCHGANGDSIPGVNLRTNQFRRVATDADLNRLIPTALPSTSLPPGRHTTTALAESVPTNSSFAPFDTLPPEM